MNKTVAEIREEMRLEQVATMSERAKGVIHNVDLKIKERKKWMAKRQRQINALESIYMSLEAVLKAEDYEALSEFATLIAEAEETA